MSLRKILFLGMLGSGKSTQAKLLVPLSYNHINAGGLIREGFKRQDPSLMPHKQGIDSGGLLPDEILLELIDKQIRRVEKNGFRGYVLDGAVRTLEQAKVSLERGYFDKTIFFDLDESVARERMEKRFEIERRPEDSSEGIEKRIAIYKEETEPVLEYLLQRGEIVYLIEANVPEQELHERIKNLVR